MSLARQGATCLCHMTPKAGRPFIVEFVLWRRVMQASMGGGAGVWLVCTPQFDMARTCPDGLGEQSFTWATTGFHGSDGFMKQHQWFLNPLRNNTPPPPRQPEDYSCIEKQGKGSERKWRWFVFMESALAGKQICTSVAPSVKDLLSRSASTKTRQAADAVRRRWEERPIGIQLYR